MPHPPSLGYRSVKRETESRPFGPDPDEPSVRPARTDPRHSVPRFARLVRASHSSVVGPGTDTLGRAPLHDANVALRCDDPENVGREDGLDSVEEKLRLAERL